jgi:hypothetical protein
VSQNPTMQAIAKRMEARKMFFIPERELGKDRAFNSQFRNPCPPPERRCHPSRPILKASVRPLE